MANTEPNRKEKDAVILNEEALDGIAGGYGEEGDGCGIFPKEPGDTVSDDRAELLELIRKTHPEIWSKI